MEQKQNNPTNKKQKLIPVTEEARNPMWKSKDKGMIPISEMDDDYLQTALLYSQTREWYFYKKMSKFTDLIKAIDAEAEKRGVKLKDISEVDADNVQSKRLAKYWRYTRKFEQATKKAKSE
jgi:hypothetical protein